MLDLNAPEISNEKQNRTTQVRHSDRLATLIERATAILGVDKSVFLRNAIAKEARQVIEDSSRHVMSEEDVKLFSRALDKPPAPTQRAVDAAKSYGIRVHHAD